MPSLRPPRIAALRRDLLQAVFRAAEADPLSVLQLLPAGNIEGYLAERLPGPLLHQVQGGNLAAPLGRDP